MKKIVSLLAVVMMLSLMVFAATANEEPYLVLDQTTAAAGDEVVINVSIVNNPGFGEGILYVSYDETALEPMDMIMDDPDDEATLGVQFIRIGAEMNFDQNGDYVGNISKWNAMAEVNMENGKVVFAASKNMSKDDVFMNMGFKVKDDAVPGTYEVTVYVEYLADDQEFLVGQTFTGTVVIPCEEHVEGEVQIENVVEASCTQEGSHDEVTYCVYCGIELSRQNVVDAKLPHTAGETVIENEVPASCQAPGSYDEVVYCSVCGEEMSRTTVAVDQLAHTPGEVVIENEVAASCQAAGSYDEVVYCSACGEELSRTTVAVDQLAHTPAAAVIENEVAGTCLVKGSYDEVVYCSVCGEELSRTTVETELGDHVAAEAVMENVENADCQTPGSYDLVVYCSVCGEELSREHVEGELGNHAAGEVVIENEVAGADCQTPGSYDEVVYCTICGCELSRETKEGKVGEHKIETVVTEPNCCFEGKSVEKCALCGEVFSETVLPATGEHALTFVDNEDGKTHKVICSNTNEVLNAAEDHTYGEFIDDPENEGWKYKVCDKCGYIHREGATPPPTGDHTVIAVVAATLAMLGTALVISKKKEF